MILNNIMSYLINNTWDHYVQSTTELQLCSTQQYYSTDVYSQLRDTRKQENCKRPTPCF
jgi:hypothetical protein